MHITLFVLLLGQLAVISSREAFDRYDLLLQQFYRQGRRTELGAFLVRDGDARLRLILWREGTATEASTNGPIPGNCIAIVHTHPVGDINPSLHDRAVAQRIGLPILVVTPFAVTAAWPDGTISCLDKR